MNIEYIRRCYDTRARGCRIVRYCYLLLRIIDREYRTMAVHPLDDDLDYLDGETK